MAITAATKTTDFSGFLPAVIAQPIFERATRNSVVQQLARQVPLAADRSTSVPVVATRPTANWVAEGATKPASQGTMTLKSLIPKKLAAIVVTSMEVVRSNPGSYMTLLRPQLAEAFAIAFDYAALHNFGGDGTGTGPFATYIDQTTRSAELGGTSVANGGVYVDFVEALDELIKASDSSGRRYRPNGWALDTVMETRIRRSVDTTGQPIWADLPVDADAAVLNMTNGMPTPGRLLGRAALMGEGVGTSTLAISGYLGDWTQAAWGVVGGIDFSVSDQTAVTINGSLVSLWENNLVAIRAEAEYAFLVNDTGAFVQLRNDSGS